MNIKYGPEHVFVRAGWKFDGNKEYSAGRIFGSLPVDTIGSRLAHIIHDRDQL